METILSSENLCKSVKTGTHGADGRQILHDISFETESGEFVAVMGPSGSGKSTLLYNLSGMDRPASGRVMFKGFNITSLPEKKLSRLRLTEMGFVFQHIHFLKNLSVFDNIVLTAYEARLRPVTEIDRLARDLMERTGIAMLADRDITEVSGGQLQRAGICRALINDPSMIFCDEPTGALDSKSAMGIMDLLSEINMAGKTIMTVTHDIRVAARSERVLYMLDGKICGEKRLGKYCNKGGSESREGGLSAWLKELKG